MQTGRSTYPPMRRCLAGSHQARRLDRWAPPSSWATWTPSRVLECSSSCGLCNQVTKSWKSRRRCCCHVQGDLRGDVSKDSVSRREGLRIERFKRSPVGHLRRHVRFSNRSLSVEHCRLLVLCKRDVAPATGRYGGMKNLNDKWNRRPDRRCFSHALWTHLERPKRPRPAGEEPAIRCARVPWAASHSERSGAEQ